jgi:peptide-methionine (S)-S-oxide reductase
MEKSDNKPRQWLAWAGAAALVGGSALYFSQNAGLPIAVAHAAEGKVIPAPAAAITEPPGEQIAILAGGCFWGVEGVYEQVAGVLRVESGYAGGGKFDADYDKVSNGRTQHTEAVRIVYDPTIVSYNSLLHIFFSVVQDPTQLNRQGPDTGRQYRSAIFPANDAQKMAAEAYIAQLTAGKSWKQPIVTRIESGAFYRAEDHHQDYMKKNPDSGYIMRFDVPKVLALKRLFPNIYRGK